MNVSEFIEQLRSYKGHLRIGFKANFPGEPIVDPVVKLTSLNYRNYIVLSHPEPKSYNDVLSELGSVRFDIPDGQQKHMTTQELIETIQGLNNGGNLKIILNINDNFSEVMVVPIESDWPDADNPYKEIELQVDV